MNFSDFRHQNWAKRIIKSMLEIDRDNKLRDSFESIAYSFAEQCEKRKKSKFTVVK